MRPCSSSRALESDQAGQLLRVRAFALANYRSTCLRSGLAALPTFSLSVVSLSTSDGQRVAN